MKPADSPDPAAAARAALNRCGLRAGHRFAHHRGGRYEVVALCVLEATREPAVAYLSLGDGTVWVRTLADFTATVPAAGRGVARFTPEETS